MIKRVEIDISEQTHDLDVQVQAVPGDEYSLTIGDALIVYLNEAAMRAIHEAMQEHYHNPMAALDC